MKGPLELLRSASPTALGAVSAIGVAFCSWMLSAATEPECLIHKEGVATPWYALLWLIPIAIFAALPLIAGWRNRLQQASESAEATTRRTLAALHHVYASQADIQLHVRACVMLVVPSGRRRVQTSTAANMDGDPDCDLEIDFGDGVSGHAATQRKGAVGDLRYRPKVGEGASWELSAAHQQAKVRKTLCTIVSVPIFDPVKPDGPLIGTLQIDSDHPIGDIVVDLHDTWRLMGLFAAILAPILKVETPNG
jgi:hypothetical protein